MSSWMELNGRRLDCNPYLSGAFEAKVLLEKLRAKKQPLHEVTQGGLKGIYHAGREGRTYVDDPKHGVPFLRSVSILSADLSRLPLLSKKQVAANPLFIVHEGWTLITRSGTVGRMAYARPEMDGLACSEDVLRVVPDTNKIPAGYLYAYLSSKFGVPIVVSGTYGAIIQHIEPYHIADLPVPRFSERFEQEVHNLVTSCSSRRVSATNLLDEARDTLSKIIGCPALPSHDEWRGYNVASSTLREVSRFDAFYHNPAARQVENLFTGNPKAFTTLGELTEDIFDVPLFKHIYVEPESGVPFFTSGDIFLLDRKTDKYLSKTQTKGLEKYILKQGWILLARSGQLGGIIGRPQYADSAMQNAAASDHVIRIVPKHEVSTSGFLYTFLASPQIGYHLLTRTMSGSSIPALWTKHLKQIKVPIVGWNVQVQLDGIVKKAFELRVEATSVEDKARQMIDDAIRGGRNV